MNPKNCVELQLLEEDSTLVAVDTISVVHYCRQ